MPLPTKSNTARPVAAGYHYLIEYGDTDAESLYLRGAVGPGRNAQIQTVEPQDKAPDVSQNPEDMRAESGETFSRSEFSGGEGLRRAHRRGGTDLDRSRFYNSDGIDVIPSETGETPKVKLLGTLGALASTVGRDRVVAANNVLYASHESTVTSVRRTTAPTGTPSSAAEATGSGTTISDLAAIGDIIYAACTDGTFRRSGTWAAWSDLSPNRIWAVKDRILGSNTGAGLYELRAGAGSVLLVAIGATSAHYFTEVVDAGAVILAAASTGEIYALADEDGTLTQVGQTRFRDQNVVAMAYADGVLLLLTYENDPLVAGPRPVRLWRAGVVGTRIRDAQLLKRWDTTPIIDIPAHLMDVYHNEVAIAVSLAADDTEIWRYFLATGGLVRGMTLPADQIQGVCHVGDILFVSSSDTDRVYREEAATYVDSGYLISPLADFYNAGVKAWVGARLQTGEMPTDTTVALAYSTDPAAIDDSGHASWTTVITATPAAPGASAETAILDAESRYVALKVTLTANPANTATPEVLAFSARGIAMPTETDYAIPVNVSDRLEIPGRRPLTVPGIGAAVYDKLHELIGQAATVTRLATAEVVVGPIRSVSTPIEGQPERGSPTVYCQLVVRGQRQ